MCGWGKTKMNKKTKETMKKIGAVAGIGLIAGAGGVALGSSAFPQTITEEVEVERLVETEVEVIKEVEVERIVEVDNENLDLVLEYAYDNDGDLELVVDGLFDDELDEVVDRIVQLQDWKAEGSNIVKSQFSRELDRQHNFDRRDVSRIRVDESSTSVSNVDFKYGDAVVTLEVEFRYNNDLYEAEVEVVYYDGKALPIDIVSVNQK